MKPDAVRPCEFGASAHGIVAAALEVVQPDPDAHTPIAVVDAVSSRFAFCSGLGANDLVSAT